MCATVSTLIHSLQLHEQLPLQSLIRPVQAIWGSNTHVQMFAKYHCACLDCLLVLCVLLAATVPSCITYHVM